MTEPEDLLIRKLEDAQLQIKNGVDALLVIAEKLDKIDDGQPEGPACYFIAEGLTAPRLKLMECIDAAIEARKDHRLRAVD